MPESQLGTINPGLISLFHLCNLAMRRKRSRSRSGSVEEDPSDLRGIIMKVAAAKASPAVVSILSHGVPGEMCDEYSRRPYTFSSPPPEEVLFFASGIIIECRPSTAAATATPTPTPRYLSTLIAPASLFHRPSHLLPDEIKIDVFGERGELYKGKLLACDFHYNLAAITITSNSPLPTATLKPINDVLSINLTRRTPFHFQSHSNLFNIRPGTSIISVFRDYIPPYGLLSGSGFFSSSCPEGFTCNELYEIKNITYPGYDGGPVLNSLGEFIGIIFNKSSFLPSNIIKRWWNHYKSSREFCRPFLGMDVANLHDADIDFLAQFTTRFPSFTTAVIVTKVEKESPAHASGICTEDVIVKLDGILVKSKMQFFEAIWEKAGKSVECKVLRVTNGKELNMSLVIENGVGKVHKWPHPCWERPENVYRKPHLVQN